MSKRMLIEATHAEETRVVVVEESRLEELDVETSTKKQIKGNIYLAKIVRVEPSLQAAFVEYGGNRHGFLAFNEIHPDYYQIPVADKEALKAELKAAEAAQEDIKEEQAEPETDVETVSEAESDDVVRPRYNLLKKYKIQEVIHHNQIVLVQVTKEERGNKGAALTTYLSLAGRYSVLMPNNANGGGVSRKITNAQDRRRLKKIVEGLPIPDGMAVIVRTAGKERTKAEIKRDYDYLIKTWTQIRDKTLESKAPALIYEEGNIIKRTLRDVFTDEIEEVWVEGEQAYKTTKDFVKMLMPKQAKKVKQYKGDISLFQSYGIENQLEDMHNPNVGLKSGGYLVINQTEALVAIDVNSGRATRERNIEETALKTNLEAADEVARQLRLRDLAGLVVIDFIDMDEARNNHAVERRMKEALKKDRARIQMGKITGFGLMELSRQRLHSSFLETSHHVCPYCQGKGVVRSVESCAMHALHVLEDAGEQYASCQLTLTLPMDVALYVLNVKRTHLSQIESKYDLTIKVEGDVGMIHPTDFRLERAGRNGGEAVVTSDESGAKQNGQNAVSSANARRDRRRKRRRGKDNADLSVQNNSDTRLEEPVAATHETAPAPEAVVEDSESLDEKRKNRHRHQRSRHHRDRNKAASTQAMTTGEEKFTVVHQEPMILFDSHAMAQETVETPKQEEPAKKKGRPKKALVKKEEQPVVAVEEPAPKKASKKTAVKQEKTVEPAPVPETPPAPKKGGWWNKLVNS